LISDNVGLVAELVEINLSALTGAAHVKCLSYANDNCHNSKWANS